MANVAHLRPVVQAFAVEASGVRIDAAGAAIDLVVPEGCRSVLLGPPGAGKTVLVKVLSGLLRPASGDVHVHGRPLSRMSRSEVLALRREIGVAFQEGGLFSTMTVAENVAFPLRQHTDMPEADVSEATDAQLERFELADAASSLPRELPPAVRKRVGLARALVLEPGIVICDEPTCPAELLLRSHARLGGTMLIATSDDALARRVGDHVSLMRDGRVVASGPTDEVLATEAFCPAEPRSQDEALVMAA